VREDAESEIGIFVEDFSLGRGVVECFRDELIVFQRVLQDRAHFAAPGRIVLGFQDFAAARGKTVEGVAHDFSFVVSGCL
jgi:hypothetical protein